MYVERSEYGQSNLFFGGVIRKYYDEQKRGLLLIIESSSAKAEILTKVSIINLI